MKTQAGDKVYGYMDHSGHLYSYHEYLEKPQGKVRIQGIVTDVRIYQLRGKFVKDIKVRYFTGNLSVYPSRYKDITLNSKSLDYMLEPFSNLKGQIRFKRWAENINGKAL